MENKNSFVLHGNIIYAPDKDKFVSLKDGYMVVENGKITSVAAEKPAAAAGLPVKDCRGKLIMPGFADMHLHAPQYIQIGMGMDYKLLDWLDSYTFKEEPRFADPAYAREIYPRFVDEMTACGTTSSSIFATIHSESTAILCDILARKGVRAYVGKVNMDTSSAPALTEDTTASLKATEEFINKWQNHPLGNYSPAISHGNNVGHCNIDIIDS